MNNKELQGENGRMGENIGKNEWNTNDGWWWKEWLKYLQKEQNLNQNGGTNKFDDKRVSRLQTTTQNNASTERHKSGEQVPPKGFISFLNFDLFVSIFWRIQFVFIWFSSFSLFFDFWILIYSFLFFEEFNSFSFDFHLSLSFSISEFWSARFYFWKNSI